MHSTLRVCALAVTVFLGILDVEPECAIGQTVQLDATCTVMANGQSVKANPDGTFLLSNLPVTGDLIRVKVICQKDDQTLYGRSNYFTVQPGQSFGIEDIVLSFSPPIDTVFLLAKALPQTLVTVGELSALNVVATLTNGSTADVTAPPELKGTTYTSSNPQVASVSSLGIVTAVGDGLAFITARNEGATSVASVVVSLQDPLTALAGVVQFSDGTPVVGAAVTILNLPNAGLTEADGSFELPGVKTAGVPFYTVRAKIVSNQGTFIGSKSDVVPVPGLVTDVGVITVSPAGGGFGPIIISGMDPEDHGPTVGGPGWQMIQDIAEFVVENSALSANPSSIAQLGGTTANKNILVSAVAPLGYSVSHFTGSSILLVDFMQFDAIYMPTSFQDVSGGLSQADLDLINQRGQDIIAFANAGGGIAAFAQNLLGGFGWFPLGGLQTGVATGSTIAVTPEGNFILSPSATAVTPFHQAFIGPAGFFGLDVLAREGDGQQLPLIVGGLANIGK